MYALSIKSANTFNHTITLGNNISTQREDMTITAGLYTRTLVTGANAITATISGGSTASSLSGNVELQSSTPGQLSITSLTTTSGSAGNTFAVGDTIVLDAVDSTGCPSLTMRLSDGAGNANSILDVSSLIGETYDLKTGIFGSGSFTIDLPVSVVGSVFRSAVETFRIRLLYLDEFVT